MHHGICTTDGTLHLCLDVYVQKTEHQVEDGLEMFLRMVLQVVGNGGHIGAHVFQCSLHVVAIHRLAESQQKRIVVEMARIHVVRHQRIEHAVAHLCIGNAQSVFMEHWVVFLDGQVTALVEQRQCVGHFLRRTVERIQRHVLSFQGSQVHIEPVELLQQESRRSGAKPIRGYLL